MKNLYCIVVIVGDGIGKEVMFEGMCVLCVVVDCFDILFVFDEFGDWCIDYYVCYGMMMLVDWVWQIGVYDVIFFGVVGVFDIVFDYVVVWELLIKIWCEFD